MIQFLASAPLIISLLAKKNVEYLINAFPNNYKNKEWIFKQELIQWLWFHTDIANRCKRKETIITSIH